MKPMLLPAHQLRCFYQGGALLSALRGTDKVDWYPEEWLASATARFGETVDGISTLPDGRLVTEAIASDPAGWLGPDHVAAFGADPAVLVKLLDGGERLPVHVHPNRAFAGQHLNCPYGKTEAWVIIETTGDDPHVYLGFKDQVDAGTLAKLVESQDSQAFLNLMNRIPVSVGDTIVVPAGTAHASGEGVFFVELQEPTDFSILLEHAPYDLDGETKGHLGLGFDLALEAVDRSALTPAGLEKLRGHVDYADAGDALQKAFTAAADPYFRADVATPVSTVEVPAGFAIVVVLDGEGQLAGSNVEALSVRRGDVALVPYAAGDVTVTGDVTTIWARPPAADQVGVGR